MINEIMTNNDEVTNVKDTSLMHNDTSLQTINTIRISKNEAYSNKIIFIKKCMFYIKKKYEEETELPSISKYNLVKLTNVVEKYKKNFDVFLETIKGISNEEMTDIIQDREILTKKVNELMTNIL